jgi:hypothetical protein
MVNPRLNGTGTVTVLRVRTYREVRSRCAALTAVRDDDENVLEGVVICSNMGEDSASARACGILELELRLLTVSMVNVNARDAENIRR